MSLNVQQVEVKKYLHAPAAAVTEPHMLSAESEELSSASDVGTWMPSITTRGMEQYQQMQQRIAHDGCSDGSRSAH